MTIIGNSGSDAELELGLKKSESCDVTDSNEPQPQQSKKFDELLESNKKFTPIKRTNKRRKRFFTFSMKRSECNDLR